MYLGGGARSLYLGLHAVTRLTSIATRLAVHQSLARDASRSRLATSGLPLQPPSIRPVQQPCTKSAKFERAMISSELPSMEAGSSVPTPTAT